MNMNKLMLHLSNVVEVSNLIPTILDEKKVLTEIVLDNYDDFKDSKITLCLIKKNKINLTIGTYIFATNKIEVPTELLDCADTIKIQLCKNGTNTILYLSKEYQSIKKIYANNSQLDYFNMLQRLLSKVIELDVRLQALELEKEQELL